MPPASERPLQKVTLNLFRDDVAELVRIYGSGWTTEVRYLVENHVREHRAMTQQMTFGGTDGN